MVELKPVAWRYRFHGGDWYLEMQEANLAGLTEIAAEIEPLITLSQAQEAVRAARAEERERCEKALAAVEALDQFSKSVFMGMEGEKNRRASWRGVMRKVRAAAPDCILNPPALDSTGGADA